MKPRDVLGYMKILLEALAVLDEHHCIHRDIKPANFLYRPANLCKSGEAKYMLIDFGLAQTIEEAEKVAHEGQNTTANKKVSVSTFFTNKRKYIETQPDQLEIEEWLFIRLSNFRNPKIDDLISKIRGFFKLI